MSDNSDGTPTFQGLRHSIFSLVAIANILQLDEAKDAVTEVVEVALQ